MAETSNFLQRLASELGFTTLRHADKDVYLLFLARFLRMAAYGSSTLILALFFATLGHSDTKIGLFMTLTLIGDVVISLALTFVADSLGRRNILILGALLMVMSGCVFATVANYWILLLAAIVGVISPSGNEIGPFRAVEEATLAQLSDADTRSDIFAWYVVVGTAGTALGSFGCGWLVQYLERDWRPITAYKFIFWIYAVIGLLKALVSLFLSKRCEVQAPPQPPKQASTQDGNTTASEEDALLANGESAGDAQPAASEAPKKITKVAKLSRQSMITLAKLCGLFFFDSLASGMVPYSLIAFYMSRKFGMPEGELGTIMSTAQFVSSVGSLLASAIAKRIGLVKAMVFTHLPSAIFLGLVPLPSSLLLTVIVLVARSSLSSMDQAPRSAFLAAVVLPEERTATMGIVNTVKTMSQSGGPLLTGALAGRGRFWIAFVAAGALKASYDVGMLTMFVNLRLEGDRGAKNSTNADEDENGADASGPYRQVATDSDDDTDAEDEETSRGSASKTSNVGK